MIYTSSTYIVKDNNEVYPLKKCLGALAQEEKYGVIVMDDAVYSGLHFPAFISRTYAQAEPENCKFYLAGCYIHSVTQMKYEFDSLNLWVRKISDYHRIPRILNLFFSMKPGRSMGETLLKILSQQNEGSLVKPILVTAYKVPDDQRIKNDDILIDLLRERGHRDAGGINFYAFPREWLISTYPNPDDLSQKCNERLKDS